MEDSLLTQAPPPTPTQDEGEAHQHQPHPGTFALGPGLLLRARAGEAETPTTSGASVPIHTPGWVGRWDTSIALARKPPTYNSNALRKNKPARKHSQVFTVLLSCAGIKGFYAFVCFPNFLYPTRVSYVI